ncbi:hypothetical protein HPB50_009754 [Hyalomma asiaticum]|uniref:Uncharacterized protein n=1 Tax=Hyalomma asiaticum TaxID=266040 RepID=A0ACB7RZD8_HYAAI|nr:hypothetical protein HPB50_009754 [Hyalomma asiaticum]
MSFERSHISASLRDVLGFTVSGGRPGANCARAPDRKWRGPHARKVGPLAHAFAPQRKWALRKYGGRGSPIDADTTRLTLAPLTCSVRGCCADAAP